MIFFFSCVLLASKTTSKSSVFRPPKCSRTASGVLDDLSDKKLSVFDLQSDSRQPQVIKILCIWPQIVRFRPPIAVFDLQSDPGRPLDNLSSVLDDLKNLRTTSIVLGNLKESGWPQGVRATSIGFWTASPCQVQHQVDDQGMTLIWRLNCS